MEATQVPKRPRTGNHHVDPCTSTGKQVLSIEATLMDIGYTLREILVRQSVLENTMHRIENALTDVLQTNKKTTKQIENRASWRRPSAISKSPSSSPGSRVYYLRRRPSPISSIKKNVSFRRPDCYDRDPEDGKLMSTKMIAEKVKRFSLASPKRIAGHGNYEGHSDRQLRKSTDLKRKAEEENTDLAVDHTDAVKGREYKRGVRRVFNNANSEPELMDMNFDI